MDSCTMLRRARAGAAASIIAAGVLTAAAPAFADPPAEPPGRSAEAPGLQEAPPGEATGPADPAPPGPPADVPPGPRAQAEGQPAGGDPAGPPPHVPPGPPAHAEAQGPPEEVPPGGGGGAGEGDGTGNGEEPPGNAGTVKVHEVGTPDDDRRNEPKVCDFRIVGFGFPADASLVVSIVGHGGPNAGTGSFGPTAPFGVDAEGGFAIDGPTLPDGMYKLFVENTTAPGGAKQKVFKIDCPPEVGGTEEEPPEEEEESTDEEEEVLGDVKERPVRPAAAAEAEAAALPTQVLGVQATRGALAFSGAHVTGLALLGAALIGGGYVLRRRHA